MSKTTDKLIDDIIELILGDMDCHHDVDHDEDGVHTSVEYNLNDEVKLRGMIGELIDKAIEEIQKPEVTEEWIEEKAQEVMFLVDDVNTAWNRKVKNVRDFIRSLIEEIK